MSRHHLEHSLNVDASADQVWQEVTQVDLASFRHPLYLSALGIPRPLGAEVLTAGIGGARVASFENDRRFTQEITDWQPPERYAFTFQAHPGFRVAYVLDLFDGPLRMVSAEYSLSPADRGIRLSLICRYELLGARGAWLRLPVSLVMHAFVAHLLRSIRANSERRARERTTAPSADKAMMGVNE